MIADAPDDAPRPPCRTPARQAVAIERYLMEIPTAEANVEVQTVSAA